MLMRMVERILLYCPFEHWLEIKGDAKESHPFERWTPTEGTSRITTGPK
jgi:hypothetical protein